MDQIAQLFLKWNRPYIKDLNFDRKFDLELTNNYHNSQARKALNDSNLTFQLNLYFEVCQKRVKMIKKVAQFPY